MTKQMIPHAEKRGLSWVNKNEFQFPKDMIILLLKGQCMEPLIREGEMVFATPHTGGAIAPGVPVYIEVGDECLCKFWHGQKDGMVTLQYLNDGYGRSGTLVYPASQIKAVWIIRGIWFTGIPIQIKRPVWEVTDLKSFAKKTAKATA